MTATDHPPLCLHPDYREFLRAIVRDPDDDTVRLGFADWLQEHGDADWAEYIRAAVELVRGCKDSGFTDGGVTNAGVEWIMGNRRAASLLPTIEPRVRRGAKCGACGGKGGNESGTATYGYSWKRCPTCHGTGWKGTLAASARADHDGTVLEWRHKCDWHRGFPHRVYCTMRDVFTGEKPTGWAMALVREWPVGEVVMTDREPSEFFGDGKHGWWDCREFPLEDSDDLPGIVWDAIERESINTGPRGWKLFDTPDLARTALARATCRVFRKRAGVESGVPPVGGIE